MPKISGTEMQGSNEAYQIQAVRIILHFLRLHRCCRHP